MVVVGVGNPDRGDDGAGPAVASRVERARPRTAEAVARRSDPTAVIDDLAEAEVAFVVDACRSGAPPGTVRRVEIGDDPLVRGPTRYSSHGLGVAEAIELARALGRLPRRLVVFSIEGQDFRLGAGLSAPVKEATRAVADRILDEAKSLQGLKG